jgi:hypothetical protein
MRTRQLRVLIAEVKRRLHDAKQAKYEPSLRRFPLKALTRDPTSLGAAHKPVAVLQHQQQLHVKLDMHKIVEHLAANHADATSSLSSGDITNSMIELENSEARGAFLACDVCNQMSKPVSCERSPLTWPPLTLLKPIADAPRCWRTIACHGRWRHAVESRALSMQIKTHSTGVTHDSCVRVRAQHA